MSFSSKTIQSAVKPGHQGSQFLRPDGNSRRRRIIRMRSILLFLMLLPVLALARTTEPITSAAWLAGCWAVDGKEAGTGEQWMAPAGGTMLGAGRTVKDGKTVGFEFMQIRSSEEGKLEFVAMPSGQNETTFSLVSSTEGSLVFENPGHDFPQRIMYRSISTDQIIGRAEGSVSGSLRGIDFPMSRIPCEATLGPTD